MVVATLRQITKSHHLGVNHNCYQSSNILAPKDAEPLNFIFYIIFSSIININIERTFIGHSPHVVGFYTEFNQLSITKAFVKPKQEPN